MWFPKYYEVWQNSFGQLPPKGLVIDHKDRDPNNNELSNLRLATVQQNSYNQEKYSTVGVKGVYLCGRNKNPWQAQIRIDGKKVNLGRFATKEEAAESYKKAALEHHGEFACLTIQNK